MKLLKQAIDLYEKANDKDSKLVVYNYVSAGTAASAINSISPGTVNKEKLQKIKVGDTFWIDGQLYMLVGAKNKPVKMPIILRKPIKQYKNIHMIGIGGSSMSGIAEILKKWDFNVTGSDSTESDIDTRFGVPKKYTAVFDLYKKARF